MTEVMQLLSQSFKELKPVCDISASVSPQALGRSDTFQLVTLMMSTYLEIGSGSIGPRLGVPWGISAPSEGELSSFLMHDSVSGSFVH